MLYIAIISLVFFSSCASIINGPEQKVTILSDPIGADITINGQPAGQTPQSFLLVRSKDHEVAFSKEGYHAQTVKVTRSLSPVAVLYLLPGGLLSYRIDAKQGSQFEFSELVKSSLKPLFDPSTVIASHLELLKSLPPI